MAKHEDISTALATLKGAEVMFGKGGFWVRSQGFITLAEARKLTGVAAPKRERRERVMFGGDWGMIGALNRARS